MMISVDLISKGCRSISRVRIVTLGGLAITFKLLADTLPSVTRTFKAPFARASREDDYRTAWAFFKENQS